MRRAVFLLAVALVLSGCTRFPGEDQVGPTRDGIEPPPPIGPPLRFGGVVRDALTGAPIPSAHVRVDLAQALPCGRQGIGWSSWEPPIDNGTWGPLEVPRPRSDDVAFFVHAYAEGYAENATFIGPTQARGEIGNLSVVMHPDAAVEGRAPPGTVVALDAPPFPRVTVAGEDGAFSFPRARAVDAAIVAATDVPYRTMTRAPAAVDVPPARARGWVLEGTVKGPTGAPLAASLVAWNGSQLWSAARASDTGAFAMPLPPEPVALRIEARTEDDHYGGVLALDVKGPPALRETVVARALC